MNQPIAFKSLIEREIPPMPKPLVPRMPDLFEVARGMEVSPALARLWREAANTQFPTLGFSAVAIGALAMEFECQRAADRRRMKKWLMTGRGTMSRRVSEFLRHSDFASPRAISNMQEIAGEMGSDLLDRLGSLTDRPDYAQRWAARNERGKIEAIRTVICLIGGFDLDADVNSLCRVIDELYGQKQAFIEEAQWANEERLWSWYEGDWLWPVNSLPGKTPR
jgi:hypothetical protein